MFVKVSVQVLYWAEGCVHVCDGQIQVGSMNETFNSVTYKCLISNGLLEVLRNLRVKLLF